MSKRMTVVFDDEDLYTTLKVHAARTHRPAKDIVADALNLLFERLEAHERARADAERDAAAEGEAAVQGVLQELGLRKQPLEAGRSR